MIEIVTKCHGEVKLAKIEGSAIRKDILYFLVDSFSVHTKSPRSRAFCFLLFEEGFVEAPEAAEDEDDGGGPFDGALGDALAEDDAHNDADAVGDDHAAEGAAPYGEDGVELCGERDGGELGLVAHFGDEEGYGHGPEGAGVAGFVVVVGDGVAPDGPEAEDDEGHGGGDVDPVHGDVVREPLADDDGEEMVRGGSDGHGGHDGLPRVFRGEGDGQELGFVAHFGEHDEEE